MKINPLLPVTSVDRPDWGFLSDVLGRETRISPPADRGTAVALLKGTLAEAYAQNPNKLVMMACHPTKSKGKTQALDHFRQEMGQQDGIDYVTSRLLNAKDDAGPALVRDAARGSSHNGIDYWDPERCGVAPYIKARVGYIIKSYYSQKKEEPHHASLDEMASRRIDIDTNGEVVRQFRGGDSDDTPDLNDNDGESPSSRLGEVDIDEDVHALPLDESTGFQEIVSRIESAERDLAIAKHGSPVALRLQRSITALHDEAKTRLRDEIKLEYTPRPDWVVPLTPDTAHSLNRPDVAFFSKVLPADQSSIKEGDIPEQIRSKTRDLLDIIKLRFPLNDLQILVEDIDEGWDPATVTVFRRYPEIVSMAVDHAVDAEFARRSAEEIPSLHAAEVQTETQMVVLFEGDAESRSKRNGKKTGTVDGADVKEAAVWRSKSTTEDLCDIDRREDYLFFCERLGIEPKTKLKGAALYAEIKNVARQWVTKTAKFSSGLYLQALEEYDPAVDGFFTEVILDVMRAVAPPPLSRIRKPAERSASLIAKINDLRDTNDRDEPELF